MITDILKNIIVGAPGWYNMLFLEIEIEGETNFERNPTIFHEYTHYLQNMTTINGFVSLDKYIHVLLKSFRKLGSDPVDPKIPLKSYNEFQSVLGDKNIENILRSRTVGMEYDSITKEYLFQATSFDDYIISEQEYVDQYSKQPYKIPYIAIDGKNIPINETIIKENMALVNSIIGSPKYNQLTQNDIDEILSFEHKEYNVLFDFINHYLPDCDLLKLVYCICELSLNIIFSEQIMGNILRFIQRKSIELSKMNTEKIIFKIKEEINYDVLFSKMFSIVNDQAIMKTTAYFSSFDFSKNQFISIMKNFYDYLIKGIEYRATKKTLYENMLTNDYMQKLATVIGCPIIFFKSENEYRGLSETPEYFFSDFTYLHGALKIFNLLYDSDIESCPFRDRKMCKVPKNDKCYNDCLGNYNDEVYKNCLLSNVLNCTGIRQERRCT